MMPHATIKHERDVTDEFGRNKLHYAANNGSALLVLKLLDEGIDINAQDNNGWTALHFAAQNSHFAVIDILLKHKANPNLHDKQGNGPLWVAAMNVKEKHHAVIALLSAKADPDHANHHGRSPMYIAKTLKNGLEEVFSPFVNKES